MAATGRAASFVPSLKITPAITAGSNVLPFSFRQWFWADSTSLKAIARHATRLPEPLVLLVRNRTVANRALDWVAGPKTAPMLCREVVERQQLLPVLHQTFHRLGVLPLERGGELPERLLLNPFTVDPAMPKTGGPVWQGTEHILLNQIRYIRANAPASQLIGLVYLGGDGMGSYPNWSATWPEVRWQVFALLGGGFQGLAWRRGAGTDDSIQNRAQTLSQQLAAQVAEISKARPVKWVRTTDRVYLSALRTDAKLFIALLDPDLMKVRFIDSRPHIVIPTEQKSLSGELVLSIPKGIDIRSGVTLSGRQVDVFGSGGSRTCRYLLAAGGDLLIFDLTGESQADLSEGIRVRFKTLPSRPPGKATTRPSEPTEDLLRDSPSL